MKIFRNISIVITIVGMILFIASLAYSDLGRIGSIVLTAGTVPLFLCLGYERSIKGVIGIMLAVILWLMAAAAMNYLLTGDTKADLIWPDLIHPAILTLGFLIWYAGHRRSLRLAQHIAEELTEE